MNIQQNKNIVLRNENMDFLSQFENLCEAREYSAKHSTDKRWQYLFPNSIEKITTNIKVVVDTDITNVCKFSEKDGVTTAVVNLVLMAHLCTAYRCTAAYPGTPSTHRVRPGRLVLTW